MTTMRHILSLILIAIMGVASFSCLENKEGPAPEDVFLKYYGGASSDVLVGMGYIPATNEYILVGNSNSNSEDGDILIVKTQENGNQIDEIYIQVNDTLGSTDFVNSVKVLDDAIAIVGYTETIDQQGRRNFRQLYWAFYDFDLQEVASGLIDSIQVDFEVGVDLIGNDIIQTSDGNIGILATTGEDTDSDRDVIFYKISSTGQQLWKKTNSLNGTDVGVSLIEFTDGTYGSCSQTERFSDDEGYRGINTLFLHYNNFGNLRNSISFGRISGNNDLIDDIPTKMINDGANATIIGNSEIDGRLQPFIIPLTKIDAVDSVRSIPISEGFTEWGVNDIQRALNGDYIFAGIARETATENNPNFGQQMMFLRSNQLGISNLTTTSFGDGQPDEGVAIIQLPGGGILLGGTVSFGGTNTKMVLAKLNRSGQLFK